MKTVALYSIKGGVGKTSSAVNLAFNAARSGYRTLIWDLDPQAASSYYFRIQPKVKGGSKDLIAGKRPLDGLIKATDFDKLDLLPADFSFRNMDLVLDTKKKPTRQLKNYSPHWQVTMILCSWIARLTSHYYRKRCLKRWMCCCRRLFPPRCQFAPWNSYKNLSRIMS